MLANSQYARPTPLGRSTPYGASNSNRSMLNFTRARVPKSAITRVRVPIHHSYVSYVPVTPGAATGAASFS